MPNRASRGEHSTRILVVHGPNLNLLGRREPHVYGTQTLADIEGRLEASAKQWGVDLETFQSNHEGALIDRVQEAMDVASGIVINPGGLTHTSVSLRDALVAVALPVVEVHLSNVYAREAFRSESLISPIAMGVITGLGADGYLFALEALARHLQDGSPPGP